MPVVPRLIGQIYLSNNKTTHLHWYVSLLVPSNSGLRCSGSPLPQVYWTLQIVSSFSFTAGTSFCGKATIGARVLVKTRRRQYRYPARCTLYFGHAGSSIQSLMQLITDGGNRPRASASRHDQEISSISCCSVLRSISISATCKCFYNTAT